MRRVLCTALAVFVMVAPEAFSQAHAPKPSAGRIEKQLMALNKEWSDAEVKHDEATLQRILDERFICTDEDGKTTGKADFIKDILQLHMTSQDAAVGVVQIHGDTAVLVGTTTVHLLSDGKEKALSFRYTVVYLKRNGQWRAMAEQFGRLPAAE
ncbi:MAG TPA: nuclear transport factor 2 family protein [Candidatus Acidoferrum sp.]|nr:nuclear transport factor 2 family protein [Candidatus Acidoferrum sp.]